MKIYSKFKDVLWKICSAVALRNVAFYNGPMDEIDDIILEALSFYDQQTMNELIMSLDESKLHELPHFNMIVLEERLRKLIKKKYVTKTKAFKEYRYQRRVPPRPLLQRLRFL